MLLVFRRVRVVTIAVAVYDFSFPIVFDALHASLYCKFAGTIHGVGFPVVVIACALCALAPYVPSTTIAVWNDMVIILPCHFKASLPLCFGADLLGQNSV